MIKGHMGIKDEGREMILDYPEGPSVIARVLAGGRQGCQKEMW